MLPEITQKVKRKITNIVSHLNKSGKIDKPQSKFICESVMGIILSKSCNLRKISMELREDKKIKHTLKRIQYNVSKNGELLEKANDYLLKSNKNKIREETIIALDTGDISHVYGEKFEKSGKVRDGSSKKICKGYWLNQISCYNESEGETFPLFLDIYTQESEDFKSANAETFKAVEKFISVNGIKGLWVLDRGYDAKILFEYFLSKGLNFIIRMRSNRDLIYRCKKENILKLSEKINHRYSNGIYGRYGYFKCYIETGKNRKEAVTLISYKGARNKNAMLFLCNSHIKKSREILRRIKGYFHRWGVEECYRFEKQGFGIEKSQVRKYNGIKCLLGLIMLSWQVLMKIKEDEYLKEILIKKAKREKTKKKYLPKFIYYQLLDGISNLFRGVRKLFMFRNRYDNESIPKGIFDNILKKELILV